MTSGQETPIFDDPYLDRAEVQRLTGLATSTLYDLMKKDRFPRPLAVSERVRRWPMSEVTAWMNSLPRSGQPPKTPNISGVS